MACGSGGSAPIPTSWAAGSGSTGSRSPSSACCRRASDCRRSSIHPDPSQAFVPLGLDRTTVPIRGSHFLRGVARLRANVSREPGRGRYRARGRPLRRRPAGRLPAVDAVCRHGDAVVGGRRRRRPSAAVRACWAPSDSCCSSPARTSPTCSCRAASGGSTSSPSARRWARAAWRLVAATMAESALVAVAGGAVGLVCANAATGLLLALRPAGLPRLETISFDWPVLLFLAATVAVVAVLVGIVPAVRGSRATPGAVHADGKGSTAGPAHRRVRGVLVASEVALVDRAADRRGPRDAQLLEPAVGGPGLPHRPAC